MKKKNPRIAAAALAAIMALSVTGCGEDTIYIGSSEGADIPSGLYINYLLNAYYEAQGKMTENDTDVFAITIDDMNAKDWMISQAKKDLKEYLAVEKQFTEHGLEYSDDEQTAAKVNVDGMWEYYGGMMEDYGIAESSFLKYYENGQKSNKLFEAIYGEGGTDEVSDESIKTYMTENYALVNFISMHLADGEGNLLKSDGKAERMEMAKDYVERAKNGEDMDVLNSEYEAYMDGLIAEAQAKAAEGTAAAESTAGIETGTAEAEAAAADQMSPAETEGAVTTAESTDETEAETAAETAATETDTETITETTAETTAPADAESEETSLFSANLGEPVEELPEDGAAEEEQLTSNKQVIAKDSTYPSKELCDKVFNDMQTGDITIIESADGEYYYVVQKLDLLEDDEYFTNARDSLLYEMKDEDFENVLSGWAEEVDLTLNEKAVERYIPEKFAEAEKKAAEAQQ